MKRLIKEIFVNFEPEIVFHASAYKHVSPMDAFPMEAVETNIKGTDNILKAVKLFGCKIINISTDKVVNNGTESR